jgi:hypothetical protein
MPNRTPFSVEMTMSSATAHPLERPMVHVIKDLSKELRSGTDAAG